jgi:hypothetical protein
VANRIYSFEIADEICFFIVKWCGESAF